MGTFTISGPDIESLFEDSVPVGSLIGRLVCLPGVPGAEITYEKVSPITLLVGGCAGSPEHCVFIDSPNSGEWIVREVDMPSGRSIRRAAFTAFGQAETSIVESIDVADIVDMFDPFGPNVRPMDRWESVLLNGNGVELTLKYQKVSDTLVSITGDFLRGGEFAFLVSSGIEGVRLNAISVFDDRAFIHHVECFDDVDELIVGMYAAEADTCAVCQKTITRVGRGRWIATGGGENRVCPLSPTLDHGPAHYWNEVFGGIR